MGRRLSQREAVLLVVVFTLCVLLMGYMFWLRPQLGRMQSLKQQVAQLTAQAAQVQKPSKLTSNARTAGVLDSGALRLPHGANEPELLAELAKLQEQTHVSITSVQQSGTSQSATQGASQMTAGQIAGLANLSLALQVQGSAAQIEQFFAGLGNLPRLVAVTNVSLGADGKTLTGSLVVNEYYAP